MRFTTALLAVLPAVAFTLPNDLTARQVEPCAPTGYTLSDFTLVTSSTSAYLNFNFKSTFANVGSTVITDTVTTGSNCQADGPRIPNNNVCSAPNRNLLFDLRGPQDTAHYQITHTWQCNGKQWMSSNDVTVGTLNCNTVDGVRTCAGPIGGAQQITPQNVRQIPGRP